MSKETQLAEAVKDIKKQYGAGAIMKMSEHRAAENVEAISTGNNLIDSMTGIGGLPRGRVVEIFGPECLAEDTFIQYETRTNHRANNKGGTIRRLYERFNSVKPEGDGRGKYQRPVTQNAEFFASSMNEAGRVVKNKIKGVVRSGLKKCYRIETNLGQTVTATLNHRFFTGKEYVCLSDLSVGDTVHVHNNTPFTVETKKESNKNRKFIYVHHHPIAGIKICNGYTYHRVRRARAVMESVINGLTFEDYIGRLNEGAVEGLKFIPREINVHHKDENESNDAPENLELLHTIPHGVLHANKSHNNLRFKTVPSTITSISPIGEKETYDILMDDPYHNFIADGFVVHNSGGKTTLCLQVLAQAQALGGTVAYIDAEHALNIDFAAELGVKVDDMFLSQPENGEEALEIVLLLVRSGAIMAIVVDSVAALVPRAELEGDMGDAQMGLQARLMSQAMRKLTKAVHDTKTLLIFINQVRDKIGVMFGNPETTAGGRALKFYSSIRVDIRRISQIKKADAIIGQNVKCKIIKNKFAAPYRDAEIPLIYGQGLINPKEK